VAYGHSHAGRRRQLTVPVAVEPGAIVTVSPTGRDDAGRVGTVPTAMCGSYVVPGCPTAHSATGVTRTAVTLRDPRTANRPADPSGAGLAARQPQATCQSRTTSHGPDRSRGAPAPLAAQPQPITATHIPSAIPPGRTPAP
jgi:hypothetical protein